jgi:hypothetical protein
VITGCGGVKELALSFPPHAAQQCDREVAVVVARFAGAALGLLAFTITVIAGLLAQNPVGVTLSRSLFALLLFCLLGLALGTAAQLVIAEYESSAQAEIRKKYGPESAEAVNGDSDVGSHEDN